MGSLSKFLSLSRCNREHGDGACGVAFPSSLLTSVSLCGYTGLSTPSQGTSGPFPVLGYCERSSYRYSCVSLSVDIYSFLLD